MNKTFICNGWTGRSFCSRGCKISHHDTPRPWHCPFMEEGCDAIPYSWEEESLTKSKTPKERITRRLQDDIQYELASGTHTYHQCDCGRKKTRAGRCSICLEEELKRLEGEGE